MDIAVNYKGGASIVRLKPVFSTSGVDVFVASKSSVYQYNTRTGKLAYEYKGWDSDIIGLHFNIIDSLECIAACSENGTMIVWKIANRVKLVEAKIPIQNVASFHLISCNLAKGLDVLISYTLKKKKQIDFALIKTKTPDKRRIFLSIPKNQFAVDVCGDKYFSVVSENVIHFYNLKTFKHTYYQLEKNTRKFTCVGCHPEEQMVLTGDDSGRIVLWQNIFGYKKTQAVYHWHSLPAKCVTFSTLGSYFYSGAEECVLVKWQIDNPNQKQFLPRLPGAIVHVSVSDNNAFAAVATSDNAVRIIDSRMDQISLIQHLVLGKQFESGIVYDPITRALVMNGNIGCVQFYSPNDQSLLYNVDIVNQNKITDEREYKLENTDVKKLALSKSGKWLVTIEDRKEGMTTKEIRLKFWFFNSEKQTYELNTSIEFPHEMAVSDLALEPVSVEDNLKCITVGYDKTFKIWQLFEVATVHRTGPIWKCVDMGTFRDLKCKGLSFSIDGSLFAVGFDSILTIWATENCKLKSSLLHSNFKDRIKFVQFGQANQCHLIATAGKIHLSVWNILTLTMTWTVRLQNVNLLVSDPLSTYMVLICGPSGKGSKVSNNIYVFEPLSPNILYSGKNVIEKDKGIVAAAFAPSMYSNDTRLKWFERTNLYLLNGDSELYCISKSEEPYEYAEEYTEDLSEEMSVFKKMKPQIGTSEVKHVAKHHLFAKDMGYKSYRQYLEAPIETLPPIRLLAASLLKSLVLQRENHAIQHEA